MMRSKLLNSLGTETVLFPLGFSLYATELKTLVKYTLWGLVIYLYELILIIYFPYLLNHISEL